MLPISKYLKNLFAIRNDDKGKYFSQGSAKADYLLNKLIAEKKVPGLAIIVQKKGELLFQRGYGFSDLEKEIKVDPQKTIFRIASVSKNIAATALAHMVKDGLIDLDASLYNYVSYYPRKKFDFTLRQLASHTAGIRGYQGMEYGLNKPYSIKESIEIFQNDELLFEPGTDYHYNSYDWVLIALAMQEVSGVPFEEYVQQKVLLPIGMQSTFPPIRLPEFPTQGQVGSQKVFETKFYSKNKSGFREAIPVNNFYKLAGGGYLSTCSDIAKFGQTHLGKRILGDKIWSQFIAAVTVNGKSTYYGLGWQVSKDSKGRAFYGHVGNGVGGYSNLFIYPKEQMVFSILVNCTNPRVQDVLDEVIDVMIS